MSGTPAIRVELLGAHAGRDLRIAIDRPPAPALSPAQAAAWRRMCDSNPRLHDGPILAVSGGDAESARLDCTVDSYARLAVQRDTTIGDLGVRLLGVKAMLVGRDAGGVERVLLARRGSQTFAYPGLWEIGPAGGVQVPAVGIEAITSTDLAATLVREGHEELGIDIDPRGASIVLMVLDEIACSVDLILSVSWPGVVDPRAGACKDHCGWEYVDLAWLSRPELAEFHRRDSKAISPPTLGVLGALHWL